MRSEGREGIDHLFTLCEGTLPFRLVIGCHMSASRTWMTDKPSLPDVQRGLMERPGVLRLEVDTPTYERCGLPGKPIRHEGRKHIKARYGMFFPSACRVPTLIILNQRSNTICDTRLC